MPVLMNIIWGDEGNELASPSAAVVPLLWLALANVVDRIRLPVPEALVAGCAAGARVAGYGAGAQEKVGEA